MTSSRTADADRPVAPAPVGSICPSYFWHLVWLLLAAAWIIWWIRRQLLMPRYLALQKEREDLLTTTLDLKVAIVLLVATVALAFGSYNWARNKYPRTVPLQAGRMHTPPLP